ncbi:MAG: bifunctional DedA family/phosphatase PAP2 family protein [Solirubrobacterales bacterium]
MKLGGDKRERVRLAVLATVFVGGFIAFQQLAPNLDIEGALEDLSRELGDFTYALVGLLAFLETGAFVGLVFPGETAVILGGAVAGQGEISLEVMVAVVWFCAWAGDSVSFLIGARVGKGFVLRHGSAVRITPERFAQVEDYFERHGGKTIVIGRFLGLVRALAPFIAGSSGMRYRAFAPFSVIGTGLWSATFTVLGYAISESLNRATEIAGRGTFVFGAVVVAVVGAIVVTRFLRVPENRRRVAARLESIPGIRRLVPQLRFFWARFTPGGLGLELTTLVATLSVALFVLVAYTSIVGGDPAATAGDTEAIDVTADLRADWLVDVAKVVTALGGIPATPAVALVAGGVLGARRRWAEVGVLAAALVLVLVAVPVLKDAIDRPRPPGGLVEVDGSSFPSGHAAYSVIYAWLALTIAVRVRPGMANASVLIGVGIVVAGLVGLSRVYLDVHYLSDVSAGWGLGVAAFAACAAAAMLIVHLRQNQAARDDVGGEDRH